MHESFWGKDYQREVVQSTIVTYIMDAKLQAGVMRGVVIIVRWIQLARNARMLIHTPEEGPGNHPSSKTVEREHDG
jgi:hypothetical protein